MATSRMGGNVRKHRKKQLFKIWGHQGQAPCYWCLRILIWQTATIEHFLPRALDGTNDLINLRLACKECNEGHVNPLDICHPKQRLTSKICQ